MNTTNFGSNVKYINHSFTPNSEFRVIAVDNVEIYVVYSIRTINKGYEITSSYRVNSSND